MNDTTIKAATDVVDGVVAMITPDQYDLPTPCADWNVKQVANHLLALLQLGEALFSNQTAALETEPGQPPAVDLIGDDLIGAYRSRVELLVSATTSDALSHSHTTPFGQTPGLVLAGLIAMEVFVHGWDLAKATGQSTAVDGQYAELMLGFAVSSIHRRMAHVAGAI
jgi:uncharacterized protein (TIGR03086 family)